MHPRNDDRAFRHSSMVEKAWLLSAKACDAEGGFEVYPDANFGVGVVLSESSCYVVAGGPVTERFTAHPDEQGILWLRFRPGLLPRIADVTPAELVDTPGIALDRVKGVNLDDLGERLLKTPDLRRRLEMVEEALRPALDGGLCQDSRCRHALELADALDGGTHVQALAQHVGLSTRTLERLMRDQVGLHPKQLLRHVRLQRAIAQLKDRHLNGAAVASACGYVDQSHMIKEFHQLTGRLPSAF